MMLSCLLWQMTSEGNVLQCQPVLSCSFPVAYSCFGSNPEERPTASELRRHKYLTLPEGWVFSGFT